MKFVIMMRTWVSRRAMHSAEILGSMPIEQCLATALFSSDCMEKGPYRIISIKSKLKTSEKKNQTKNENLN
jgi:hypothetical protein